MTVQDNYAPSRQAGNGSKTDFDFNFDILTKADLVVNLIDANNVSTPQTIPTHYTVTIDLVNGGGTVAMVTAPAATEDLLIERNIAKTQPTEIPDVGSIRESQLENEYDRSRFIDQQIQAELDRCFRLSIEDSTNNPTFNYNLPRPDTNKDGYLKIATDGLSVGIGDADLTNLEGVVSDAQAAQAAAEAARDAAQTAQTAAETAETNAETAETNAETAQTAAEAAQAAAEAAVDTIDDLEANIILNTFNIMIQNSLTVQTMVNAVVDDYQDKVGIDSANSENFRRDASDFITNNAVNGLVFLLTEGTNGASINVDESCKQIGLTSETDAGAFDGIEYDNVQAKFGSTSIINSVDGVNDDGYASVTNSFDYSYFQPLEFTDWTLNFWARRPGGGGEIFVPIILIKTTSVPNDAVVCGFTGNNEQIKFRIHDGSAAVTIEKTAAVVNNTWYHLAFVKVGDDLGIYLDGTQIGYGDASALSSLSDITTIDLFHTEPSISMATTGSFYDDVAIITSNIFSASPNVGLTDIITAPTTSIDDASYYSNLAMTLVSETQIAQSIPSTGQVMFILDESAGAVTINTDVIVSISRDDGTTYTAITMSLAETLGTNIKYYTGSVDISGQPSGTNMKYKITTTNSKEIKVLRTALLWD